MNEHTFRVLELFDFIELAARRTQTPAGRTRVLRARPLLQADEVRRELEITSECVGYQQIKGRFGLAGVEDLAEAAEQLHIAGAALEAERILDFERLLVVGKELKENILGVEPETLLPHLRIIVTSIPDVRPILSAIRGRILPGGEIDDSASPELREVRAKLTERRHRINRTLEAILRASPEAVQDEIITFRNGRFVIPIRTDSRGRVPGVMHGLSASGQTTYIEPLSVIEQNNDMVRLEEQEHAEIARILLALTDVLRQHRATILTVMEVVATLDAAQARALIAGEFDCAPPVLAENGDYILTDARHILLEHELRKSGARPVPISLELSRERNALVISGPNAGGKTVALKTAGLISLMAQMGFHVPARTAVLPVFSQIFADIGDQQSIAANLSTFTAHMHNLAEISTALQPPALILLDELGAGTDPDEGAALAIAIIDAFRQTGAVTLASTHYPRLKVWASEVGGVRNASVEFDERVLRPTYRLLLDVVGASSGIEIARRMNIPEAIVAAAQALVEPDNAAARTYLKRLQDELAEQEATRAALDDERKAVAEKFAALEHEAACREAERRAQLDASFARALEEFARESERALGKVNDRIEAARVRRAAANLTLELRGKAARIQREATASAGEKPVAAANKTGDNVRNAPDLDSNTPESIEIGDVVLVTSLNREGVVEAIQDEICVVAIGAVKYRANLGEVEKRAGRQKPAAPRQARTGSFSPDDPEFATELNVIGLTVDATLDRVDRFLDQAFLAGVESIRIIHGHGRGVLKRAVAGFLDHHAQVARFEPAPPEHGGSGATVVFLRE